VHFLTISSILFSFSFLLLLFFILLKVIHEHFFLQYFSSHTFSITSISSFLFYFFVSFKQIFPPTSFNAFNVMSCVAFIFSSLNLLLLHFHGYLYTYSSVDNFSFNFFQVFFNDCVVSSLSCTVL